MGFYIQAPIMRLGDVFFWEGGGISRPIFYWYFYGVTRHVFHSWTGKNTWSKKQTQKTENANTKTQKTQNALSNWDTFCELDTLVKCKGKQLNRVYQGMATHLVEHLEFNQIFSTWHYKGHSFESWIVF